jgi:hypothetical protein
MPAANQHVAKVKSNLAFIQFVLRSATGYLDWVVTAYFYASMHLVEAYFDLSTHHHFQRHLLRRQAINADAKISHLFNAYRQLETYSREARYGTKIFDLHYINNRVVPKFQTIQRDMASIYSSLNL